MNYYNENNPHAAAWLRELIRAGHIAPGIVDARSILDVPAAELAEYCQCHFFAGIGGWSYALRLAGWPDDAPVWTGSCPCQPFSAAGKRRVDADERHLWPAFRARLAERRPSIVFGEQVASKDGRIWLAGVRADLEALGYALGSADLCAAGLGAPHIRQRLYWVAYDQSERRSGMESKRQEKLCEWPRAGSDSAINRLADAERDGGRPNEPRRQTEGGIVDGRIGGLGIPKNIRREQQSIPGNLHRENCQKSEHELADNRSVSSGATGAAWSRFDLIPCRDGKARRIESGTFPLAHGIPGRVGLLRGYGNAIVPQLAEEFIQTAQEAIEMLTTNS